MNTEIKFDLQRALKGEKVETCDGRLVSDVTFFPLLKSRFRVRGVVEGHLRPFTEDGESTNGSVELQMVQTAVLKWVNLYRNARNLTTSNSENIAVGFHIYNSRELAVRNGRQSNNEYIGTAEVLVKQ